MTGPVEQVRHTFARAVFAIVVTIAVAVAAFVIIRYLAVR
jgi:hypothetical protein